jgi:hypothetical protein
VLVGLGEVSSLSYYFNCHHGILPHLRPKAKEPADFGLKP